MDSEWLQLITSAVLGWLAWELRQLRHDVGHRVHYNDCDRRMEELNRRISRLEQ